MGGVGWDNNVHVPVHTQARQQALLFHHQLLLGWGGVGWDNNVHVPVHTQARQPHHLSCCPADTGTTLSSLVTAGVGWGGVG